MLFFFMQSYSQQGIKKHETDKYAISYPEDLVLKESKGIYSFIISNFNEETEFNFPLITLSTIDCSRLGMGTRGMMDGLEKGKKTVKRTSEKSNIEFEETISEEGGIVMYQHIYTKDYIVYCLVSLSKTKAFAEKRKEIDAIMDTFELK